MNVSLRIFFIGLLLAVGAWQMLSGHSVDPQLAERIEGLLDTADSLRYKNPDRGLELLMEALSKSQGAGLERLEADTEYRLSRAYMGKGYYHSSLQSGLNALRYYESIGDSTAIGKAKHRVATIYLENGNKELSFKYDSEALALLDPQEDSLDIAWTYLGLGNYMDVAEDPDSALYYYGRALSYALAIEEFNLVHACYNNMALIHIDLGDFDQALSYYQKGIAVTEALGNYSGTAFIMDNVGALYFKMGNYQEALRYSAQAYGMALEHQTASGLVNIHSNLARAYSANGQWDSAYVHQAAYTELIKGYFNDQSAAAMADMEGKYQSEQQQAEINLLNKENELKALEIDRQSSLQKLLGVGLALLAMLVIVVVLAYRDKQRTNRLLQGQKMKIKQANAELELKVRERTEALANVNTELNNLLYRTSHDLRTPITKLMGLVELARTEALPTDKALDLMGVTMEQLNQQNLSVTEIGIIRHHDPQPVPIQLTSVLHEVVEETKSTATYSGEEIQVDFPGDVTLVVDPYLLKISVKEILVNALAFGKPPVVLRFSQEASNWKILVTDQGPGVPPEVKEQIFDLFVKGTHAPGHFGLGLYKARLAVERMGGELSYRTEHTAETAFEMRLRG